MKDQGYVYAPYVMYEATPIVTGPQGIQGPIGPQGPAKNRIDHMGIEKESSWGTLLKNRYFSAGIDLSRNYDTIFVDHPVSL